MRSIVWYRAILKNHTIFIFYIMQNMNVAVSSLKYGYDYNEFTKMFKGFHDIDNSFFPFGRRVECYMICKKWMCGSQPFLAEQEAQLTRVVANWSKQSATMFFSSVDLSDGCDVGTTLFSCKNSLLLSEQGWIGNPLTTFDWSGLRHPCIGYIHEQQLDKTTSVCLLILLPFFRYMNSSGIMAIWQKSLRLTSHPSCGRETSTCLPSMFTALCLLIFFQKGHTFSIYFDCFSSINSILQ